MSYPPLFLSMSHFPQIISLFHYSRIDNGQFFLIPFYVPLFPNPFTVPLFSAYIMTFSSSFLSMSHYFMIFSIFFWSHNILFPSFTWILLFPLLLYISLSSHWPLSPNLFYFMSPFPHFVPYPCLFMPHFLPSFIIFWFFSICVVHHIIYTYCQRLCVSGWSLHLYPYFILTSKRKNKSYRRK